MAYQKEYMLSGLERELELYRGAEYEAPRDSNGKTHTIAVIDTAGKPMSFTFSVDQNKKGYVSTSDHTYKKSAGLTTKTFKVPGLTQLIVALNKKGNTAFLVLMDFRQFNEDYDASKPATVNNMSFNVVKQNALTQFEILESKTSFKVSVFIDGKWMTTEYPIQEPVARQIEEFKVFISGLQLEVLPEKYFDEKELEFKDEEYDYEDAYDNELEYEEVEEPDDEFEWENELNALEDDGVTENFARRLYELSTRSYESEYELDEELDRALDAVEDEFMVKRLHRKKKRGKRKGLFKKILSTGAKIVGKIASKTPIGSLIKAGTSLVRGDIKGALGNLAKSVVGAVLPPGVGTVATAAMDALGGGGEEGGEGGEEGEVRRGGRRKRAIRRVARIARDTYREVADTLPEDFDHPLVANEVARKAVRKAMVKNGVRPPGKAEGIPRQKRVIRLRPGERVVITG
ncbi:conserved hypothetical protein [Candidatus Brocadia pituitae]|nr:conserved hypothetical protein [Candidatus Brocadia pituitae]